MLVTCEWYTCKNNAGGYCQSNVVTLYHVDNEVPEVDKFQEALVCKQYEWGKLPMDKEDE